MVLNLAELVVICLVVDWLFRRWRIPGLVGMLLVGIALGPQALNQLQPELAAVSADLRRLALIVILLRAGFELSKDTLQRVGGRAFLFSFVPAVFEGAAITFLGPALLGLTLLESAILGSVLAAVSPAVVVPLMLEFMERRKGTAKGIPTLILAASSLDDVFVIVVYSGLIGLYTGEKANWFWRAASIPVSVLTGIAAGLAAGWALYLLFRRFNPRATKRLLIVLGVAVLLTSLEQRLEGVVPFAALLAVMAIGFVILERNQAMAHELSRKLAKLWVFAEIILFALVGAKVDVAVALRAGPSAALLIALALVARSLGAYVCLLGSDLTVRERLFVVVSYIPKATVQAAIGGAPLLAMTAAGMNTAPGETILAVAALSILLTAPVGAWAIRLLGERWLPAEPLVAPEHRDAAAVERDLLQRLRVRDVLDPDPAAVMEHEPLQQVLRAFAQQHLERLPVVDTHGRLRGVIHLADLKPLLAETHLWAGVIAADAAHPPCAAVPEDASLFDTLAAMDRAGGDEIPVVGADGAFVGMAARRAIQQRVEQETLEWMASTKGRETT